MQNRRHPCSVQEVSRLSCFFCTCPRHHTNLPEQPYEVIKELLLNDLTVLPVSDRAKLDLKPLVRGWNRLPVRPFHRPLHGSCEPRNRACPITLTKQNLIWVIVNVIIWKCLEVFDGFSPVVVSASRRF